MTTKVTVTASCDGEMNHVLVRITGEKTQFIEDGDSQDFYVYDDREIVVREVGKVEEAK